MIDRTHDLPVVRQVELLELARSSCESRFTLPRFSCLLNALKSRAVCYAKKDSAMNALTGQRRVSALVAHIPWQTVANTRMWDVIASCNPIACLGLNPLHRKYSSIFLASYPPCERRRIHHVLDIPNFPRGTPSGAQSLGFVLFREGNQQIYSHFITQ